MVSDALFIFIVDFTIVFISEIVAKDQDVLI